MSSFTQNYDHIPRSFPHRYGGGSLDIPERVRQRVGVEGSKREPTVRIVQV